MLNLVLFLLIMFRNIYVSFFLNVVYVFNIVLSLSRVYFVFCVMFRINLIFINLYCVLILIRILDISCLIVLHLLHLVS